jgi:hypothetical protein
VNREPVPQHPCDGPPDEPLRDVVAAVTCWLDGDRARGHAFAAAAIDRGPVATLDAIADLWTVVGDVAAELTVDVRAIIRDVALGIALAEVEDGRP